MLERQVMHGHPVLNLNTQCLCVEVKDRWFKHTLIHGSHQTTSCSLGPPDVHASHAGETPGISAVQMLRAETDRTCRTKTSRLVTPPRETCMSG